MWTDIPKETAFVVKESGEYRLWKVTDDGQHYSGVCRPLKAGDVVHLAVWKPGDRLESRKTYTLRDGDVTWQSSGLLRFDKSPKTSPEDMRKVMRTFEAMTVGDLLRGKLPRVEPERPPLPETEENYVFHNVFNEDSKAPVWIREAR